MRYDKESCDSNFTSNLRNGCGYLRVRARAKMLEFFFATLQLPRYSAPLWVWTIIGGAYYLIFFSIIYRLLRLEPYPAKWYVAVGLIGLHDDG
jgi:hypothetical protein